jgi:hypothetical protein
LDLDDFATFADCLTGPNTDPAPSAPMLTAHCVQLFDLDRDYDVDLADFARLQEWMGHPGRIMGTVEYTGTDIGDTIVAATGAAAGFEYTATLAEAGPFLIELWRTDDYAVSAFLDANGNGARDAGEPWAPAQTTPLHVQGERGLADDVFIDLGPYTLNGQATYDDGTPAPGVALTTTGPTATTVSTGLDGSYLFGALLGGDYVITPSDPDRYFYPFDAALTVVGDDVAGIDFEAHDLPTGEVDGEESGVVSAVDLAAYSITIDVGGEPLVVYVYADTVYSGFATKLQEVTVGHAIEAQFYTPSNLAVHIDTDP